MTQGGRFVLRAVKQAPDIDIVLAMAAFVALLVDPFFEHNHPHVTVLETVLALATSAPLVVRRRFPLAALVAVVPLVLLCLAVFHPNRAAVGVVMLAVFTVGAEGGRTCTLVVGALMAPVVAAAVFITSHDGFSTVNAIANLALVLVALAAGDALRDRDYERVSAMEVISPDIIGNLYKIDPAKVNIYRIPSIRAVKISFPRLVPQGSFYDRDMHSGQQHIPLSELRVPPDEPAPIRAT